MYIYMDKHLSCRLKEKTPRGTGPRVSDSFLNYVERGMITCSTII